MSRIVFIHKLAWTRYAIFEFCERWCLTSELVAMGWVNIKSNRYVSIWSAQPPLRFVPTLSAQQTPTCRQIWSQHSYPISPLPKCATNICLQASHTLSTKNQQGDDNRHFQDEQALFDHAWSSYEDPYQRSPKNRDVILHSPLPIHQLVRHGSSCSSSRR